MDEVYDLMVFGVTGFTGKFVAEEIYRIQNSGRQDLKWAVAGRSKSKIDSVLQGQLNASLLIKLGGKMMGVLFYRVGYRGCRCRDSGR